MEDLSAYPPSVRRLIEEFGRLPGVGKRSAERMAFHILATTGEEAMELARTIRDVKKNIRACERCYHVAENDLCSICSNMQRDHGLLCVVELPRDIIALEKAGAYRGVYHVLQGRLNPAEGMGPEEIRIAELLSRIEDAKHTDEPVREVILATNPTTEGDATASYLSEILLAAGVEVSRLARGLSSGTDLESAVPSSLQFAFTGRQRVQAPPDPS